MSYFKSDFPLLKMIRLYNRVNHQQNAVSFNWNPGVHQGPGQQTLADSSSHFSSCSDFLLTYLSFPLAGGGI